MSKKQLQTNRKQTGQTLLGALALLFLAATATIVLYNTAQTATEKTRLVNAADAAAYSGGVWVARQLNFIAYTNRAMLANHVMIGHMVSYASWISYVENTFLTTQAILTIVGIVFPPVQVVNTVVGGLRQVATVLRQGNDALGPIFTETVDVLNTMFGIGQALAVTNMQRGLDVFGIPTPLQEIMENTAAVYAPTIRINDLGDMDASLGLTVAAESAALAGFVRAHGPEKLNELTQQSLGGSRDWLQDREWGGSVLSYVLAQFFGGFDLRKRASTTYDAKGWHASDKLQAMVFDPFPVWVTVTSGSADSDQFGYAGLPGYVDLADGKPRAQAALYLTALASMPIAEARQSDLLGFSSPVQRMAALARAEIYHERPSNFTSLGTDKNEYANVYNPFWAVRLVAPLAPTL